MLVSAENPSDPTRVSVPKIPLRQVHLDFHTSPLIPGIGSEFDADAFAETLVAARVQSVTVFAKCHHGMCYYPTKTGVQHPGLGGRDLFGEQIEALHRRGIRVVAYTTVAWEEDVATKHPEWRQLDRHGLFLECPPAPDPLHPGKWKCNNFLHPGYQDYIEAHTREILADYDVDGMFYDIVGFNVGLCWSPASMERRSEWGLLGDDQRAFEMFQGRAQAEFCEKFTGIVRSMKPNASIFYNGTNEPSIDRRIGPRVREPHMSHFEIESLPSGFWGYLHSPKVTRFQGRLGKPWVGMTGRFQKMWGDFGGIKPQPALEFECFRSQALGGGNSVGDQLPPRGRLESAAYDLIGSVFLQVEAAEPFYAGSEPVECLGVLSATSPGIEGALSEEGAVQMAEESHYEISVCDSESDFSKFDLLLLPDSVVVDDVLATKIRAFREKGGRLLVSHRAGFDADGRWRLDFLPVRPEETQPRFPTFWRARESFSPGLSRGERVFYAQGLNVTPGSGTEILVDRVLPYFQRTDAEFSSHFQTPPIADFDEFPAVIGGERFVYFADPIFREYRQTGNIAARDAWRAAVLRLVGPAPFGHGLPTTVSVYPRRRGSDLVLTLLHYIPVRKAIDIDIIEERHSFAGLTLRVENDPPKARIFDGPDLAPASEGGFVLPPSSGRLLVEVPDYF